MIHLLRTARRSWLALATLVAVGGAAAQAQSSTAFTYQGRLTDGGAPADGLYDVAFKLYGAINGLNQIGPTVYFDDLNVQDGLFTVRLDFGSVFDGGPRFLGISLRAGNSTGGYWAMSPRQELTAAPAALSLRLPLEQSSAASGHMLRIIHEGASGRAGSFEIADPDNPHIALYAETVGSGVAVEGYNRGTGRGVGGFSNGPSGEAGYFRVGNAANASDAVYAETIGGGNGVHARSTGAGAALVAESDGSGPALQIQSGQMRVVGAGINTPTVAFVLKANANNLAHFNSDGEPWGIRIDHPATNGNPGAILIVTPNSSAGAGSGFRGHPYVYYGGGWWYVMKSSTDSGPMAAGEAFNVMVIRP